MNRLLGLITIAVAVNACAPAVPGAAERRTSSTTAATSNASPQRTLDVAIRFEPTTLASKALQQTGVTLDFTLRLFNAGLVLIDNNGQGVPYLAESLPALNTDSWKVFDDGTMQTTYQLRPNLTWHDGEPLTANDFVFAWQVYTNPAFGIGMTAPQGLIDEVLATDAQTVTIHWKQPFPFADILGFTTTRSNLAPLPRHLLESQLAQLSTEAFLGLPFWTTDYIGAGPYKVSNWHPGAFLDASAFDGHARGRPKIDRMRSEEHTS